MISFIIATIRAWWAPEHRLCCSSKHWREIVAELDRRGQRRTKPERFSSEQRAMAGTRCKRSCTTINLIRVPMRRASASSMRMRLRSFGRSAVIAASPCLPTSTPTRAPDFKSTISEQTAKRAGAFLHGFLLPHTIAFYASVLGPSNDHDHVTAVAGHILSHGLMKITNRDLKRGDRTMRKLGSDEALAVFEQLEAFGWLDRAPSPHRGAPPHWLVNPAVHQKFAERAKSETARRA
jgi:hypothetical protein